MNQKKSTPTTVSSSDKLAASQNKSSQNNPSQNKSAHNQAKDKFESKSAQGTVANNPSQVGDTLALSNDPSFNPDSPLSMATQSALSAIAEMGGKTDANLSESRMNNAKKNTSTSTNDDATSATDKQSNNAKGVATEKSPTQAPTKVGKTAESTPENGKTLPHNASSASVVQGSTAQVKGQGGQGKSPTQTSVGKTSSGNTGKGLMGLTSLALLFSLTALLVSAYLFYLQSGKSQSELSAPNVASSDWQTIKTTLDSQQQRLTVLDSQSTQNAQAQTQVEGQIEQALTRLTDLEATLKRQATTVTGDSQMSQNQPQNGLPNTDNNQLVSQVKALQTQLKSLQSQVASLSLTPNSDASQEALQNSSADGVTTNPAALAKLEAILDSRFKQMLTKELTSTQQILGQKWDRQLSDQTNQLNQVVDKQVNKTVDTANQQNKAQLQSVLTFWSAKQVLLQGEQSAKAVSQRLGAVPIEVDTINQLEAYAQNAELKDAFSPLLSSLKKINWGSRDEALNQLNQVVDAIKTLKRSEPTAEQNAEQGVEQPTAKSWSTKLSNLFNENVEFIPVSNSQSGTADAGTGDGAADVKTLKKSSGDELAVLLVALEQSVEQNNVKDFQSLSKLIKEKLMTTFVANVALVQVQGQWEKLQQITWWMPDVVLEQFTAAKTQLDVQINGLLAPNTP